MDPSIRPLDPLDPDFLDFQRRIFEGATAQDIYVPSTHGLADRGDAATHEQLARRARREFLRTGAHLANLALPLDRHFGLAGTRVLDFGCGSGALAVAMGLVGARVVAADPMPASLAACRARARYHGLDAASVSVLRIPSAPGLPLAGASFDRVVCNSVLEFIPAQRAAHVAELVRLVRPGGLLVVSGENGAFPRDYYTGLWLPYWRRRGCVARNLPYGATWRELREWVAGAGRRWADLSVENRFNSIDKLAERLAHRRPRAAAMVRGAGRVAKAVARRAGVPVDVLLPYATWVFRIE